LFDFSTIPVRNYWILIQVFARVSSLIAIAPVFGATQVPTQVKVLLAVVISLIVWPLAFAALQHEPVPTDLYTMTAALIANALIGLAMGFVVSLTLTAVQMAGAVLDLQVGFTMAQTFNPEIGELAAPLTQLQYLYSLLLFLLANGHYLLISALGHSFALLPASSLKMASTFSLSFVTELTSANYNCCSCCCGNDDCRYIVCLSRSLCTEYEYIFCWGTGQNRDWTFVDGCGTSYDRDTHWTCYCSGPLSAFVRHECDGALTNAGRVRWREDISCHAA